MQPLEAIALDAIEAHLRRTRSAVPLPFERSGYHAFRGRLEASDRERLVLWWQFRRRTLQESCRVADLITALRPHRRTLAFLQGDPARRYAPVDLRGTTGLELVLLASRLSSERLYIIDGNNRTVAQQLAHGCFAGVPVYLAVHPELRRWDALPTGAKRG